MGSFRAGDTFLIGKPGEKQHLHVVLCDPAGTPPTLLVVSFNTVTLYTDTTLQLGPGDHPFITRATAVSFDTMNTFPVDQLDALEKLCLAGQGNSFRRHDPVSADLLARIVAGALKSDLTPKRMARALKERLNIED